MEATQTVIGQLQVLKKALLTELLTRGLPGRHRRFKQTELGEVPEEWKVVALADAGQWLSGGTPSKARPELWQGTLPWVSPKDMKVARVAEAEDHVAEDALDHGTRAVEAGTLLMVVRGMILAHSFPVALTTRRVAFNQDIKALVPTSSFDPSYLLYWLESQRDRVLGISDASSHGTKRIPSEALFALPTPVPRLDEQRAIASTLAAVDDAAQENSNAMARLREFKAGVASPLLSGDLRVRESEQ